jgi:hypothetical protein
MTEKNITPLLDKLDSASAIIGDLIVEVEAFIKQTDPEFREFPMNANMCSLKASKQLLDARKHLARMPAVMAAQAEINARKEGCGECEKCPHIKYGQDHYEHDYRPYCSAFSKYHPVPFHWEGILCRDLANKMTEVA